VGQHDPRLHLAHDRRHLPQQAVLVEDLDVIHEARVVRGPHRLRSCFRLGAAEADDLLVRVRSRAAVAVGHRMDVAFVARVGQQCEGAGHGELDVIRVRAYGERSLSLGHAGLPPSVRRCVTRLFAPAAP